MSPPLRRSATDKRFRPNPTTQGTTNMRTRASTPSLDGATLPPAIPFCELCRTGLINANGTAASHLDCRISPHRLRCTFSDGGTPPLRLRWDTTSARDSFCAVRLLPACLQYVRRPCRSPVVWIPRPVPSYTMVHPTSISVSSYTCVECMRTSEVTNRLTPLSFPTASPLHRPALQSKRLHVRRLLLRRLHRGSASPSSRPSA